MEKKPIKEKGGDGHIPTNKKAIEHSQKVEGVDLSLIERGLSLNDLPKTAKELTELQEILNETKNKKTIESKKRYERLVIEFDLQVANLIRKGFVKKAKLNVEEFRNILKTLKEKLIELSLLEFPKGQIPFIIVPREKLLSLKEKIELIELQGRKGSTLLDLSKFKTVEYLEIPETLAYLIVDVGISITTQEETADNAERQLKEDGRSPITIEEGVALALQYPRILEEHNVIFAGSRYDTNQVADLWLHGNNPEFSLYSRNNSNPRWSLVSCGNRIG
ncbi:hypothetical protein IT399_00320 [Candidatus Nomurabacteria bacterium]|nr:hypothetical protein [Candidatus Nomurabacteria bacterium]